MSLRLRLLLIVCLTFAAVFAGAWTTSLYVRHIERVRVDARQQALDAETRLDDAHDALIAELHLRRSPGIDLELVQSHAVARESALQGLIRRVGIQDADALLREVLALRRRLDLERSSGDRGLDEAMAAEFEARHAQLIERLRVASQQPVEQADRRMQLTLSMGPLLLLSLFAVGIILCVVALQRWVVGPMATAERTALALADGDWAIEVPSDAPAEAGRVLRALMTLRDELVHAEARRRAHEEDLVLARDEAVQAAEARQRFLAAVSHELRTPLHGIIGVLDLLADDPGDRDHGLLQAARQSSRDLHELVEDILSYTTTADSVESRHVDVDGWGWVSALVDRARPLARQKGISLDVVVPGGSLQPLSVDLERVGRAVHHLVDNAVKFTDEGGVVVRVEHAGDDVVIQVVDTGPGIPSAVLAARLPFAVGDDGWTRSHRGTGIGLGLVHALARRLGGRVLVRSTGEGTEATLRLPTTVEEGRLRIGA